jgi:putative copper export protein
MIYITWNFCVDTYLCLYQNLYPMRNTILILILAMPTLALAHPGHGTSNGNDWLHYFSSPSHLAPAALLLTFAILLFMLAKRSAKVRDTK